MLFCFNPWIFIFMWTFQNKNHLRTMIWSIPEFGLALWSGENLLFAFGFGLTFGTDKLNTHLSVIFFLTYSTWFMIVRSFRLPSILILGTKNKACQADLSLISDYILSNIGVHPKCSLECVLYIRIVPVKWHIYINIIAKVKSIIIDDESHEFYEQIIENFWVVKLIVKYMSS